MGGGGPHVRGGDNFVLRRNEGEARTSLLEEAKGRGLDKEKIEGGKAKE